MRNIWRRWRWRRRPAPFDPYHYPRIAQLTQRSNQFNLRTVRYTEAEIEAIAGDYRRITRYFCLRDKFGDHGLVSVVILGQAGRSTQGRMKARYSSANWLMSCRVLKRGMEGVHRQPHHRSGGGERVYEGCRGVHQNP